MTLRATVGDEAVGLGHSSSLGNLAKLNNAGELIVVYRAHVKRPWKRDAIEEGTTHKSFIIRITLFITDNPAGRAQTSTGTA